MARVNHVGHCVADLARAQRFYVDLLGFTVTRRLPLPDEAVSDFLDVPAPVGLTAAYLTLGDFTLELIHFDRDGNPPPAVRPFNQPGLTHLSLTVDDLDATLAAVPGTGGRVERVVPGTAAIVRDPDGQLVELLAHRD